jgi:hypothetical protein
MAARLGNLIYWIGCGGAALATTALPSSAAQIEVHGGTSITIDGKIEHGDFETFKVKTSPLGKAVVVLASPGGNLLAGIQIGEMIRLRGWSTYVPSACASACALAWLGGTQRFMTPIARIGFHAASLDGQERASLTP